jgi:LruC domain-containing protein
MPFEYPKEKIELSQTYLKFIPWGESGGLSNTDWYIQKAGYRNQQNIYLP